MKNLISQGNTLYETLIYCYQRSQIRAISRHYYEISSLHKCFDPYVDRYICNYMKILENAISIPPFLQLFFPSPTPTKNLLIFRDLAIYCFYIWVVLADALTRDPPSDRGIDFYMVFRIFSSIWMKVLLSSKGICSDVAVILSLRLRMSLLRLMTLTWSSTRYEVVLSPYFSLDSIW
jgi:hypothetical protein